MNTTILQTQISRMHKAGFNHIQTYRANKALTLHAIEIVSNIQSDTFKATESFSLSVRNTSPNTPSPIFLHFFNILKWKQKHWHGSPTRENFNGCTFSTEYKFNMIIFSTCRTTSLVRTFSCNDDRCGEQTIAIFKEKYLPWCKYIIKAEDILLFTQTKNFVLCCGDDTSFLHFHGCQYNLIRKKYAIDLGHVK